MSEKSQEKQKKKKKSSPREREIPQGVQDLGLKKISKPRHREQAHWDDQALGFARFVYQLKKGKKTHMLPKGCPVNYWVNMINLWFEI
jgi:hypothetical protein